MSPQVLLESYSKKHTVQTETLWLDVICTTAVCCFFLL